MAKPLDANPRFRAHSTNENKGKRKGKALRRAPRTTTHLQPGTSLKVTVNGKAYNARPMTKRERGKAYLAMIDRADATDRWLAGKGKSWLAVEVGEGTKI